jgi:phage terminase small subunit
MLTTKKRLYVEARLSGKNINDSAIYARCPEKTARQAGSRLEKDPEVIAHMARAQAGLPESEAIKIKRAPVEKPPKEVSIPEPTISSNDDPLQFMKEIWQNPNEDPKLRLDAAKAHASFIVAKPGEKGKKEKQEEKAKEIASKFQVRRLKAVK